MQIDFAIGFVHSIIIGALLFTLVAADASFSDTPKLFDGRLSLVTSVFVAVLVLSAIAFSLPSVVGGLVVNALAKMASDWLVRVSNE